MERDVPKSLLSVIDDDESVRRATTLLIESLGFRAAAFESAETFLKSRQILDTSCVIADVQMPGMNGLELQRQLAATACRIPMIFITAYENEESRRRAIEAGAVAFLGKPFSDEQLRQSIHSALDEFSQQSTSARNLISIVDDDESVRRTTALLIESFGFRAAAFESAEKFLSTDQLLHETACLIVDVQMPGMNGLELQAHLAAAGRRIPIIFITAYANQESHRRAIEAGAVAFLGKPFSDEELLQTIRSALRREKDDTEETNLPWSRNK
jgi:FixJ family two-component response regulator